jgi:hypothetical protein
LDWSEYRYACPLLTLAMNGRTGLPEHKLATTRALQRSVALKCLYPSRDQAVRINDGNDIDDPCLAVVTIMIRIAGERGPTPRRGTWRRAELINEVSSFAKFRHPPAATKATQRRRTQFGIPLSNSSGLAPCLLAARHQVQCSLVKSKPAQHSGSCHREKQCASHHTGDTVCEVLKGRVATG